MKRLSKGLIFSLILLFSSCSDSIKTDNSDKSKPVIEKPSSPPVLEITEDAKGMWTITGKTLFIRLFDNGVVEMEFADDTKRTDRETVDAGAVNQMIRAKLTDAELQKLTGLLNSEDLKNSSAKYQRKCCCTDAALDFAVKFKSINDTKTVDLIGYCDLSEFRNSQKNETPEIPKAIVDLIILVDGYRLKNNPFIKSSNPPQ